MTISDWVTLSVGVAAIIVAVVALLETRATRLASFRPRLFLADARFYMQLNSRNVPCRLVESLEELKASDLESHSRFRLTNVGLGAAHSISVHWKFDAEYIRSTLSRLGKESGLVGQSSEHQFFFRREDDRIGFGFVVMDPSESDEIRSFLAPGKDLSILVPDAVKNAITFISYLEGFTHRVRHDFVSMPLCLGVNIAFRDIADKVHEQTISIEIEAYGGGDPLPSGVYGSTRLTFEIR